MLTWNHRRRLLVTFFPAVSIRIDPAEKKVLRARAARGQVSKGTRNSQIQEAGFYVAVIIAGYHSTFAISEIS